MKCGAAWSHATGCATPRVNVDQTHQAAKLQLPERPTIPRQVFGNKTGQVVPQTWAEATAGKPDTDFTPYAMTARFAKGALIQHPKFGKGVVVGVEAGRVEVLFEEGTKTAAMVIRRSPPADGMRPR